MHPDMENLIAKVRAEAEEEYQARFQAIQAERRARLTAAGRLPKRARKPVLVIMDVETQEIAFTNLTARERQELGYITDDYRHLDKNS